MFIYQNLSSYNLFKHKDKIILHNLIINKNFDIHNLSYNFVYIHYDAFMNIVCDTSLIVNHIVHLENYFVNLNIRLIFKKLINLHYIANFIKIKWRFVSTNPNYLICRNILKRQFLKIYYEQTIRIFNTN